MSFLSQQEIINLGFKKVGSNPKISSKASFYNCENISLGDNVRIDDFCVLSAGEQGIEIGSFIHIAVFSSLIGKEKIIIKDFANISSRVSIYSSNDDYSGSTMTNPTIADEFKNVFHAPVTLEKHVIVGSGSIILPGCHLHLGSAVGALSLVSKDIPEFEIHSGVPARKIKNRKRDLLITENKFLNTKDFNYE